MAQIGLDSTQLIAVNFPTERIGRFFFNNLIFSPSFDLSRGCWQVTEPQILHIQNERIRTNPNSILELPLCNFGPCPVTSPVSQWFQLLGVGLTFSGAYCMVGAAVGPGCLSLPLCAGLVTPLHVPTACTELSSASGLPTHTSLYAIHSVTGSAQTFGLSSTP